MVVHKKEWQKEKEQKIRQSLRFERLQAIDPDAPKLRNIIKMLNKLLQCHASILTQLCTEHCPLNQYLHHFNRKDLPECTACHRAPETVEHYLLECQAHTRHRGKMHRVTGMGPDALPKLLSNPGTVGVLF
ncbi:hypothetical protein J132_03938 [Termitomyces sp. J132]|nr:hypothetical protein J132_03938 [Termitomyces sp. J132]